METSIYSYSRHIPSTPRPPRPPTLCRCGPRRRSRGCCGGCSALRAGSRGTGGPPAAGRAGRDLFVSWSNWSTGIYLYTLYINICIYMATMYIYIYYLYLYAYIYIYIYNYYQLLSIICNDMYTYYTVKSKHTHIQYIHTYIYIYVTYVVNYTEMDR